MPQRVYEAVPEADTPDKPKLYFAMGKQAIFLVNQLTGK
jgi:hypothetical protein